MDFPAWVPECVRQHVRHYLEGDGRGYDGMLAYRDRCRERMERAATALEANELRDRLAHVQDDIDTIVRLVQDARMARVYEALEREFGGDERSLVTFCDSLRIGANVDYERYRDILQRAQQLRDEIEQAARHLAGLLEKAGALSIRWPSEMISARALLEASNTHGRDHYMWPSMRHILFGESYIPFRLVVESNDADGKTIKVIENDPPSEADKLRAEIAYVWTLAPSAAELIETLANAVARFKPGHAGFIDAAISSRKRSGKFEYLRAVLWFLRDQKIEWRATLAASLAIAASVVLDEDVTPDDVRKAAARVQGVGCRARISH